MAHRPGGGAGRVDRESAVHRELRDDGEGGGAGGAPPPPDRQLPEASGPDHIQIFIHVSWMPERRISMVTATASTTAGSCCLSPLGRWLRTRRWSAPSDSTASQRSRGQPRSPRWPYAAEIAFNSHRLIHHSFSLRITGQYPRSQLHLPGWLNHDSALGSPGQPLAAAARLNAPAPPSHHRHPAWAGYS